MVDLPAATAAVSRRRGRPDIRPSRSNASRISCQRHTRARALLVQFYLQPYFPYLIIQKSIIFSGSVEHTHYAEMFMDRCHVHCGLGEEQKEVVTKKKKSWPQDSLEHLTPKFITQTSYAEICSH